MCGQLILIIMHKLLILLTSLTIIVGSSIYDVNNNDYTIGEALSHCYDRKMDLLSLSTQYEYSNALKYISYNLYYWVGLSWNSSIGNYQWLNGRVLSNFYWRPGEPPHQTGEACVAFDISNIEWYTAKCTESKSYVCIGLAAPTYTIGIGKVDYITAINKCQMQGKTLPVTVTKIEETQLSNILKSGAVTEDFWIGMVGNDNYFKWVTGEELTPDIPWEYDTHTGCSYFHFHDGKIRCTATSKHGCICQPKNFMQDSEVIIRSRFNYIYVTDKAVIQDAYIRRLTVKGRTRCGIECSRDMGCYKYTMSGNICTTYGGVSYTISTSGSRLWEIMPLYRL